MPVELRPLKLEKPPHDFAAAFATMAQGGAQVVLVLSSPSFVEHRPTIAALAIPRCSSSSPMSRRAG
jgi:hypothetical protein